MKRLRFMFRLAWLAIPLAVAMPSAAQARSACIHSAALGGWTFVLKDASLRPGTSGAVSGYAVRSDGFASPISGGFVVFPSTLHLGITRYGTGLRVDVGDGGTSFTTSFHQLQLALGGSGQDWSWTREVAGTITNTSGDAWFVDCDTVKTIPKTFP